MKRIPLIQSPNRSGHKASIALLVAGTLFMENLDATIMAPAIPALAHSFGTRPIDINPGLSAYMMTLGIFIPISGWAADRFGARRIFASAIILFTLASLLCAMAATLPQFIATRALQGIGGALMVPVGRLVVLRDTPKEDLIHAIAILTWPALLAPILGPPLGGLIVQISDWRWIFWLNLPLGLIALPLALRLIPPEMPRPDCRFDWMGFLLVGSTLTCALFAAESMNGETVDMGQIAVAILACAGLCAAALHHLRRSSHPVFDLTSLEVRSFRTAVIGGALFAMSVSAVAFLIPLLLQTGFGFDPMVSGSFLMAVFAGNLAMKPMTTRIMRLFPFRSVLIGNGLINAVLIAACASLSIHTPIWLMSLLLFLGGMTRSMQFTAFHSIAFCNIGREAMSSASTLFSMVFQLSMGLGIALGAFAWRMGELTTETAPHHLAFVLVAFVALLAIIDPISLPTNAGDHITGKPGVK